MKNQKGLTLIELMITVVIIIVLAGIAFPAYQNQVTKARRADAHTMLSNGALEMERCRSLNATFTGCTVTPNSEFDNYTVTVSINGGGTYYQLIATPKGPQVVDTECGKLTLDSRGSKGSDTGVEKCWPD